MSYKCARERGGRLFICPANDTIEGRALTVAERFTLAKKQCSDKEGEHGGLPDKMMISVGMKVMITFNIQTDLDIANGSRGEIVAIVLQAEDEGIAKETTIAKLSRVPAYVLVKMDKTKVPPLQGLPENVVPLTPLERRFTVIDGQQKKTVTRKQLPLTPSYAFTNYHSQGQTIDAAIVDISTPPTGRISSFNLYVALSRCRSRNSIRVLRDFDEKLVTRHPCEFLRLEDARLERLDEETKRKWSDRVSC